ncbi:sigma-E factor negative regulatory protein [Aquabacterium sp. A08]|uniref:sigma-E factor negative regulatory protein n=1 Tax=Aquabacterium sp. A08 TaxID=2718532 RepID=UPI00141E4E67|nr:sigma-E factor negative regulatory protein [Aquabacterium sp. A08]NIC43202.1 sigma-E factor negative regulatory protein [Aquabacterium sp. A08]
MQNTPEPQRPSAGDDAELVQALSALLDGECTADQAAAVTLAYGRSAGVQAAWAHYHCLGEALRDAPGAGATPASRDFVAGVMGRLAQEPAPWADATPAPLTAAPAPPVPRPEASNDPVFRWKVLAGVASFLAVAALTWQVAVAPAPSAAPQLAQGAPEAAPMQWVVTDRGVVLRDPQLEELMAAHRHYGGVSALQMPAGFLRNATYEAPQR